MFVPKQNPHCIRYIAFLIIIGCPGDWLGCIFKKLLKVILPRTINSLDSEAKSTLTKSNRNLKITKCLQININLKLDLLCVNPSSTTYTITYLVCFSRVLTSKMELTIVPTSQHCCEDYENIGMKDLDSTCYTVLICFMFLSLLTSLMILLLLVLLDWEVAGLGFTSGTATYNTFKETFWISRLSFVKYYNVLRYSLEFYLILCHSASGYSS